MKIISKFKDYYDSVSNQYLDDQIIYLRNSSKFEVSRGNCQSLSAYIVYGSISGNKEKLLISPKLIGFCGSIIPVIQIGQINQNADKSESCTTINNFYNFTELNEFVTENNITLPSHKYKSYFSRNFFQGELEGYETFLASVQEYKQYELLFLKYNTPCFTLEASGVRSSNFSLTTNPFLKEFSFAKMRDPYTAHQELFQYIGGYLKQPDRPMVTLSDDDKIHKHGFDKWSFRKMPTKT
jgi:hypothetical protein